MFCPYGPHTRAVETWQKRRNMGNASRFSSTSLRLAGTGCIVEKLCVLPCTSLCGVERADLQVNSNYRESIMAARCAVCGKGPQTGFTVSHSHIRNKRTFRPNLQPVRTTIDGENVRVRVCVKCIKAGKVQRVEA